MLMYSTPWVNIFFRQYMNALIPNVLKSIENWQVFEGKIIYLLCEMSSNNGIERISKLSHRFSREI